MDDHNKIPVIISTPVWGTEYVKVFLNVALPFQLTQDNLQIFRNEPKFLAKYIIYTSFEDVSEIRQSESFKMLQKIMPVEFYYVENFGNISENNDRHKNFEIFISCHRNLIERFSDTNAIFIFFNADVVCSDGLFKKSLYYVKKGYRAICMASMRLAKETFLDRIKSHRSWSFSPRQLLTIAMDCIHPSFQKLFIGKKMTPCIASVLVWPFDEKNVLIRQFHMHPMLVWPEKNTNLNSTIDDSLIEDSITSKDKIKYIEDSDDMIVLELTSKHIDILGTHKHHWYLFLVHWCSFSVKKMHWQHASRKIFFKTTDFKDSWKKIEKRSDIFIKKLFFVTSLYSFCHKYKIIQMLKSIVKKLYYLRSKVKNSKKGLYYLIDKIKNIKKTLNSIKNKIKKIVFHSKNIKE